MAKTIHWTLTGPKIKAEAKAALEKLRQRALDLPFDAVSHLDASTLAFTVDVAPGCDSLTLFLKRSRRGWFAKGHCSVGGNAAHTDFGGIPNYLRATAAIYSLLDYAKDIGILAETHEEGALNIPSMLMEDFLREYGVDEE